ncbi:MAG: lipopolysaccharide assembly protein LapA domain-containing protein [Candidatus Aminicenantales bacterium]
MKVKTIIILVLIVLCLIILFQNLRAVTFRIFFWKVEAPQIILITVTLIIGLVMGYILGNLQKKPPGKRPELSSKQETPKQTTLD